jgi:hypothetical protein
MRTVIASGLSLTTSNSYGCVFVDYQRDTASGQVPLAPKCKRRLWQQTAF